MRIHVPPGRLEAREAGQPREKKPCGDREPASNIWGGGAMRSEGTDLLFWPQTLEFGSGGTFRKASAFCKEHRDSVPRT